MTDQSEFLIEHSDQSECLTSNIQRSPVALNMPGGTELNIQTGLKLDLNLHKISILGWIQNGLLLLLMLFVFNFTDSVHVTLVHETRTDQC